MSGPPPPAAEAAPLTAASLRAPAPPESLGFGRGAAAPPGVFRGRHGYAPVPREEGGVLPAAAGAPAPAAAVFGRSQVGAKAAGGAGAGPGVAAGGGDVSGPAGGGVVSSLAGRGSGAAFGVAVPASASAFRAAAGGGGAAVGSASRAAPAGTASGGAAPPGDEFAGQRKFCPHCDREIITEVELTHSAASVLSAVFLFLVFGLVSICVVPFVMPLFQKISHFCPKCRASLKSYSRFAVIRWREGVITLKAGSCAVVLSRTYAIVGALVILAVAAAGVAGFVLSRLSLLELTKGPPTALSWENYLEDCGYRTLLANPLRADKLFEQRYADRTVVWKGRVESVSSDTFVFAKHFLYLIMDPSLNFGERDISLLFSASLRDKVADVDPGDEVSFEATLVDMGRRRRPVLGVLWDLNVTAPAAALPPLLGGARGAFAALQRSIARPPVRALPRPGAGRAQPPADR